MPSTFQQNPRTAGRIIGGTAFVVVPPNHMYSLNDTGTFVWTLADKPVTVDTVASALARRFKVDATSARTDAETFLGRLCAMGFLVATGDA